jgi:hypothetical protein
VGRAPCLHYTLTFALQLRKNRGKTSVIFSEIFLVEQCWARFDKLTCFPFGIGLDWPVEPGCPWLARHATGVNPQSAYVSAELPKLGFPDNGKLVFKPAVRVLMCSLKNGTPKSSCICLLP